MRLSLTVAVCLLAAGSLRADEAAERAFALKVLPLLKAKCFACHGDDRDKLRGGLDLTSRQGMLEGGDSEKPSFVALHPEKSPIVRAVEWADDSRMPPKENDRLTAAQVKLIRGWVKAGAPWPGAAKIAEYRKRDWAAEETADGVRVKTNPGRSDEWTNRRYKPEDLWAYRPVRDVKLTGDGHPVDELLGRRLGRAGLTASGPADRLTLIRRATFDLTGLPPTPKEVAAFRDDESPDAFAKLIDRLLASKHYGERAAQHWLDVTRYADSDGFSNDFVRPHAWRYRDYVIRSYNADKPFDRFIVEQIAGDELDPEDPEMKIAVGYLRTGPFEHTAMSVRAVTRQQYLDDVTNSVGVTFLATGMSCCKCHDHKFDPLPTVDYYKMQAVFAPAQFADRKVPFLKSENTRGIKAGHDRIQRLKKGKGVEAIYPPNVTAEQRKETDLGLKKVRRKRSQHLTHEAQLYYPLAMSVYNGPPNNYVSNRPFHPMPKKRKGEPETIRVLTGGSLETPRERVGPGVLSALGGHVSMPDGPHGRRLALANWIASPENPLTARVIVNRIWQQHFGVGLAANPNNFGKTGAKPTHPLLLDYLAKRFVEGGWSVKKLHRLIMTSRAYRRSGVPAAPKKSAELDPSNKLLAHYPPRRLTAEEMRDAMLTVTGELNRATGGVPCRPEINLEVAMQPRHVMGSVGLAYQPNRLPEGRHRRTVYALKIRTLRDPALEVFDQPNPDTSCERRSASTVTPQVFTMFNSQASYDRALAFARRLEREAKTPSARVGRAFRLAFGRSPSTAEVEACVDHWRRMTEHHKSHPPKEVTPPKYVEREMIEEMTGLKFRWKEMLDIYANYVPDAKPWDVKPATRALADVCLVLLNSNEFVYVY